MTPEECPQCHYVSEEGALFCEKCGASLAGAAPSSASASPSAPSSASASPSASSPRIDYAALLSRIEGARVSPFGEQSVQGGAPRPGEPSRPWGACPQVSPVEVGAGRQGDVSSASVVLPRLDEDALRGGVGASSVSGLEQGLSVLKEPLTDVPGLSDGLRLECGESVYGSQPEDVALRVEYRQDLFFVSGRITTVQLRLTPLRKDVTDIEVWCSPQVSLMKETVFAVKCDCTFRAGWPTELEFPYKPDDTVSGVISLRFYFGCRCRDRVRYCTMAVQHRVIREKLAPSKISIVASEAGTVNVGDVRMRDSIDEMLEKLLCGSGRFTSMRLDWGTTWRPERLVGWRGDVHACDRLTLKLGTFMLHVLMGETIRLGRQLDANDIIVADLQSAHALNEYPNNTISRKHAQIHYCGDSVNLFDLSRRGTLINGRPATEHGTVIPSQAEVKFGPAITWKMAMQYCEPCHGEALCSNCLAHRVRSMVFTRKDRVPEAYLLVWQCCDLGLVLQELAGFRLLRREGGFLLKEPSGALVSLAPGAVIALGQRKTLIVGEYRQYGLS